MLLIRNDVGVDPSGYRLHDYIIVRIDLRSVDKPTMVSSWFVQLTLGSSLLPNQVLGRTSAFTFSSIEEHPAICDLWEKARNGAGRELDYPSFLLRFLSEQSGIHLQFRIQDGGVSRFVINLGKLALPGRLQGDVDIFASHFGVTRSASDD